MHWYNNQTTCISWGDKLLAKFKVANGVRQGGILSMSNVGCSMNVHLINHIM